MPASTPLGRRPPMLLLLLTVLASLADATIRLERGFYMIAFVTMRIGSLAAPTHRDSIIAELPDVDDDDENVGLDEQDALVYNDVYDELYESNYGDEFYYEFPSFETERQVESLSRLFAILDSDKNGRLDESELRRGLELQAVAFVQAASEHTAQEAAEVLSSADVNGDGRLSREEFERAEMLFLQHEGAIKRGVMFSFADAGADGDGAPDGHVDAHELQAIVFPEFSPRAEQLRRFLSAHTMSVHDLDGDAHLDKRELFHFHAKKIGLQLTDGDGSADGVAANAAAEAGAGGTAEAPSANARGIHHRRARFADGRSDDENDEIGVSADDVMSMRDVEYAAHNDTFEWHDHDRNGLLDETELGMYLLPRSQLVQDGYVEEEASRLLALLRAEAGAASAGGGGGGGGVGGGVYETEGAEEAEIEGFALDHLLAVGNGFLHAFETVMERIDAAGGDMLHEAVDHGL